MTHYQLTVRCVHTAEVLDRLIAPIRKRGILIDKFTFEKIAQDVAICQLIFVSDATQLHYIESNLNRLVDVHEVKSEVLATT